MRDRNEEYYNLGKIDWQTWADRDAEYNRRIFQVGKEKLIEAYEYEIDEVERTIDKKIENLEEKISRKQSYGTLLQSHFNLINSINEEQHNIAKELKASKTMAEWLNKETRDLLFNEKDYLALSKELKSVLGDANDIRYEWQKAIETATPEALDQITKQYEQQYELALKRYEILKAELEVAKKQQKLNNVLAERNVRMFTDKGWIWVANTQDVINAQNELEDAKYAQLQAETNKSQTMELQDNEISIAKINTTINELNSYVKKVHNSWEDIQREMQGETIKVSEALNSIALADGNELHEIVNGVGGALNNLYQLLTGQSLHYPLDKSIDYMEHMDNLPTSSFLWDLLNNIRNNKIDILGLDYTKFGADGLPLSSNLTPKLPDGFLEKYGYLSPIAKLPDDIASKLANTNLNFTFEPITNDLLTKLTDYSRLLVEKPVSQDNSITFNGDISLHEVNNGDNVLKNIIQQAKQLQLTRG